MTQKEHKRTVLSAILLVAGTCIGGGMLALPITTGVSGFFPSLMMMGICWFMMTTTALFLLEASLWFEEGAHVMTITSRLLGKVGVVISAILYLFICYASLIAYTAGGGLQLSIALSSALNFQVPQLAANILFITLFGSIITVGGWFVGRVNTILFGSMIIAYFFLVGLGIDEVKATLLMHTHWGSSLIAIPLLLTAFSFQTMVPSLAPYLKRNVNQLRITIIGGTSLAFLIYAVWQWVILGVVPVDGPDGLAVALAQGNLPATEFLRIHVAGYWIAVVAEYFAFFAIVTSFLGIAMGLYDFLADGLKIKKQGWGVLKLALLIIIPTLFVATYLERAFIVAMDISGGLGDSILNGIIPALLIWRGRYHFNYPQIFKIPGGRLTLLVIIAFFSISLVIEIFGMMGFVPSVYEAYDILEIHNINEII